MHTRQEQVIKKGPWSVEEDAILLNFVKKNGPREWSSIRSNNLLPRTGKSCRLRWVNKLRPDLKIGCKFSAEEERVVLDLQARIGNKWAQIATHLPGRTDNDVKNFWSSRQKKLARIKHSSPGRELKSKGKGIAHKTQNLSAYKSNAIDQVAEGPSSQCSRSCSSETLKMVPIPDPMTSSPLHSLENDKTGLISSTEAQFLIEFPDIPQQLELPLLPGNNGMELIGDDEALMMNSGLFLEGPKDYKYCGDELESPDCFLDDFPDDMFDFIEKMPSQSPP
ncbi:hypothetical protein DCAR_0205515 [Daucus carota subsp. sativus]|uniref:Uncharacterized protein n=1 Tax=Daucus carota subsp. sativus TaxID=79200 RepID=A0A166CNX3_DAUCS|nr:hypothetical protein DCAR_0205515 [Daucus carota subsp. sativus]